MPISPGSDGPLAHDEPEDWLRAYSGHRNHHLERVPTPLAGIKKHWPQAAYARGRAYDLPCGGDRRAASGLIREEATAASLSR